LLIGGSCVTMRKALPWFGLGLVAVLLMVPLPFFPWAQEHLPLISAERVPSRFVLIALLAFCMVAGHGLSRVWRYTERWAALQWVVVVGLYGWLSYDLATQARPWLADAVGGSAAVVAPAQILPGMTTWFGLCGAVVTGVGVTLCVSDITRQRASEVA
jgi:hypothetical protein